VRLPKFDYFEPKDLKEALAILQNEPSAKILAGGTDLLVNMKHRVECPTAVVNLKRIDSLGYIRQDNGTLRIGALTKLKRIYTAPLILEKLPALAQAASSVGSYHHQVMGTLAGNICQQNRCRYFNQSRWWRSARPTCFKAGGEICHVVNKKETCYSSYCGDMAPALLVMNAKAVVTGKKNAREVAVSNLFSGDGKTPLKLKTAEIVTEIIIPAEAMDGICAYTKFANRESIDFPIVGAAFWASAKAKDYRVAFTAVDRKPVRAQHVETFLKGDDLNAETVEEAGSLAAKAARPVKTSEYAPSYKRRMMALLFKNLVNQTMGRFAS
jgi:4-hydroxybenzoyl-CoA reductase subunit beta